MDPNFYAIIPSNVRYDKRIKANAKLLYGEITALCNKDGFCWATNKYFSELYNVSLETISRWISQLEKYNYLKIEHYPELGNERKIYIEHPSVSLLTKKSIPIDKKVNTLLTKKSIPLDKKVNPYNRMNNTINNTMNRESTLDYFKKDCLSLWEAFQMKYKSQISDFKHFEKVLGLKLEEEGLEWNAKKINARIERFAINFIQNEKKAPKPSNESKPAYMLIKAK